MNAVSELTKIPPLHDFWAFCVINILFKSLWMQLNVITLRQKEIDNINRVIQQGNKLDT